MVILEFTRFSHKNTLYKQLYGGTIAVHSCKITFDDSEKITLLNDFQIRYLISKRLVPKNNDVKIKLSAGTYTSSQFNIIMKNALKEDHWIPPQINKDYKLIIPENFTFIAIKPFYDILGITPENEFSLIKGEYQTKLKKPPEKVHLHCGEIASLLYNHVDGKPSTKLFSIDANILHYEPFNLIYFPLVSSPINYLHLELLDENQKQLTPKNFNLIILYNNKDECLR